MSRKVSANNKTRGEEKEVIFPDSRSAERHCRRSSFKQQSDETRSPMTINVEQEISSKLCALILGTQALISILSPPLRRPPPSGGVGMIFARRYIFTHSIKQESGLLLLSPVVCAAPRSRSRSSPSVLHTARRRLCSGN